jgi:hypothetical protein
MNQTTLPNAAQKPFTLATTYKQAVQPRKATKSRLHPLQVPREIRDIIYFSAMADLPTRLLQAADCGGGYKRE